MRAGGTEPPQRPDPVRLRERMVARDVVGRGVRDERVIAAMLAVQRHLFVDEALADRAYTDQPLPIGTRQTISRPSTVAIMSELLAPGAEDRVLEIGTGSGYQAAVLSHLCARVDTVERVPSLARRARTLLRRLGITNVRVFERDGTLGLPGMDPYLRMIVTAGAPELPMALLSQLAEGGRLIVPVAEGADAERLMVVEKRDGRILHRVGAAVSFVPLIGAGGHAEPVPWSPWP